MLQIHNQFRTLTNIMVFFIVAAVLGGFVWTLQPTTDAAAESNASSTDADKPSEKLQVGFVLVGPTSDWGFNYQHNQGRLALEARLRDQVQTVVAENIPETAEAERIMQRMINEGAELIYATSYGYLELALRVAAKNPDVTFMHCLGNKQSENLGTYSSNMWEVAYVGGVVAALTSKDNAQFGFVGAHPIPPVLWILNAFALGAQSVNKDISVDTVFTNSWYNPAAETEAVNSLASKGIGLVYVLVDSGIAGGASRGTRRHLLSFATCGSLKFRAKGMDNRIRLGLGKSLRRRYALRHQQDLEKRSYRGRIERGLHRVGALWTCCGRRGAATGSRTDSENRRGRTERLYGPHLRHEGGDTCARG